MKIERKNLENSTVELIVEDTAENIAKYRKNVLKDIEKNAEIKGFRKWAKIPEEVIVREFGEQKINHIVIERAIDNMYRNALREENLMPIAQWEIKEIISESPLKIKIEIEVLPEVKISDSYKNVKLEKKSVEVSDEEVEQALFDIKTRFTTYTEVDEKAEKWDKVTITTQGYDKDGKILEQTNMEKYPVIIGSDILVSGFEDGLIWHKKWDSFKLDVNFPKDYHNADFASKKTVFDITIDKVEKAKAPEFTEDFIEKLRWKKLDLDGFKKLIKEEILDTKESNARLDEELKLVEELLKHTEMQIWPKLLDSQIEKVYEEIRQNMANSGIKMSDYLESLKLSEKAYKENHVKENALKRLQWELILAKLAEIEKVEISEKEAQTEIDKIISKFGNEDVIKRLKELYVPGNRYYEELKQRMIYKKIVDRFFN